MLPIRTSTIFKSRWTALLWAAGIIWLAYDVGAAEPQDGNTAAEDNLIAGVLGSS